MPYPARLKKSRAVEIANALRSGGDIPAPADGWTLSELLQLAGACHDRMKQKRVAESDAQRMVHVAGAIAGEIRMGEPSQRFDKVVALRFFPRSRGGGMAFVSGINGH